MPHFVCQNSILLSINGDPRPSLPLPSRSSQLGTLHNTASRNAESLHDHVFETLLCTILRGSRPFRCSSTCITMYRSRPLQQRSTAHACTFCLHEAPTQWSLTILLVKVGLVLIQKERSQTHQQAMASKCAKRKIDKQPSHRTTYSAHIQSLFQFYYLH